jgi:predicted Zn-ribbon and HTH transcriptional regulator
MRTEYVIIIKITKHKKCGFNLNIEIIKFPSKFILALK